MDTASQGLNNRWLGIVMPPGSVEDPGEKRYAGTLILVVSSVAAGTFTIEFNPDPDQMFLTLPPGAIGLVARIPGSITITGP